MIYDDGTGSGLRWISDDERIRLYIALETEGEVQQHELVPLGSLAPITAAITSLSPITPGIADAQGETPVESDSGNGRSPTLQPATKMA